MGMYTPDFELVEMGALRRASLQIFAPFFPLLPRLLLLSLLPRLPSLASSASSASPRLLVQPHLCFSDVELVVENIIDCSVNVPRTRITSRPFALRMSRQQCWDRIMGENES